MRRIRFGSQQAGFGQVVHDPLHGLSYLAQPPRDRGDGERLVRNGAEDVPARDRRALFGGFPFADPAAQPGQFVDVGDQEPVGDVWISPSRASRADGADGEWGMSLRFYDPEIDAFRSTWLGPGNGWVIPFIGKPTEIESDTGDVRRRWVFSDLTAESFSWRAEETLPDGEPFVRQRFDATRADRVSG